jgi:hypothetical protein
MSNKRFLSPKETAALLGFTVDGLANMRCAGEGPPYYKLHPNRPASRVFYVEGDILAYMEKNKVIPTPKTKDNA